MISKLISIIQKHMPPRIFFVNSFILVLFMVLVGRVFYVQIQKGDEYTNNHKKRIEKTISIPAARGIIYDSKGKILATNKLGKSLVIEDTLSSKIISRSEYNNQLNKIILNLIDKLDANGEEVVTTLPIRLNAQNEFEYTTTDQAVLISFFKNAFSKISSSDLTLKEKSTTAEEFMRWFSFGTDDKAIRKNIYIFNFPKNISKDKQLKAMNIRFNMFLNRYQKYKKNTITENLKKSTIIDITEDKANLPGVEIEDKLIRVYNDAKYISNIVGYVGNANLEEREKTGDSVVGKMGLEKNMNDILRSKNGSKKIYVDSIGNVLEEGELVKPELSNNITLSIDLDYQKYIYNLIEDELTNYYLTHMSSSLNIVKDVREYKGNYKITIGEIYNSLLTNGLIKHYLLDEDTASPAQKSLYKSLTIATKSALASIEKQFTSNKPMKELSANNYNYLTFFFKILRDKNFILSDKINENDKMVKKWYDNELAPRDYLNYLITSNFINLEGLELDTKYTSSEEITKQIVLQVNQIIEKRSDFVKYLSRDLIKSRNVKGSTLIQVLFDQGFLDKKADYNKFANEMGTYEFVRYLIKSKKLTPGELALDPFSASVVVNDANTGKVLAMVSYPGYDSNRVSDNEYLSYLFNTSSSQLINRPTQMMKAPGSTFKPITALAALEEKVVGAYDGVYCDGTFTKVTPSPKCWVYPSGHGTMNTRTALANSCNVYFNEMGYRLGYHDNKYSSKQGIENIAKYAKKFGLDQKTGLEIDEFQPRISDENAVLSAIGQGSNYFNISNINRYMTTIANNGTLYNLSLVDKITDSNQKLIKEFKPVVFGKLDVNKGNLTTIQQGLRQVVLKSYNIDSFKNVGVNVAGKTGTAEESYARNNHSLFSGYAPYENPEIVSGIIIPNIETYNVHTKISGEIMKYYFDKKKN